MRVQSLTRCTRLQAAVPRASLPRPLLLRRLANFKSLALAAGRGEMREGTSGWDTPGGPCP